MYTEYAYQYIIVLRALHLTGVMMSGYYVCMMDVYVKEFNEFNKFLERGLNFSFHHS